MPCPFFEPRTPVRTSTPGGRLPLIDEYDGLCHAGPAPGAAPEAIRFRFCNHGNSQGSCSCFPTTEERSCLRYEVIGREPGALRVLCIEEKNYAPMRWFAIRYAINEAQIEPELADLCVSAQVLAFCRSYLSHFAE